MHVVFRESHGLEETDTPVDLGQDPADLVVLSFSDSDLGAFAAGWHRGKADLPSLRLANLAALRHPLSVDTYVERTLSQTKGILIKLIGGVPYWSYGLQQVRALAERHGIALAVLPADGRPDPRLDDASTLPVSTLRRLQHLCDAGGALAAQAALAQMSLASGLYAGPVIGEKSLPTYGAWTPETGVVPPQAPAGTGPLAIVTFYRSYLVAADTAPLQALMQALRDRGFRTLGLFAPSLKEPKSAYWLAEHLTRLTPDALINATAFSGKGSDGTTPLDAASCPVWQVALSTSNRAGWSGSDRGLSPADLAMHVVLPEVDGRIFGGVISFKEPGRHDPDLQFARMQHQPEPARISALADRIAARVALATRDRSQQRVALVLSTYPGRDWNMAHAVGLDPLASAEAILKDLDLDAAPGPLAPALQSQTISWSLQDYLAALTDLPRDLQDDLQAAWGAPQQDKSFREGAFHFAATRRGTGLVLLQPERGATEVRDAEYHDLARVPRHGFVAFYLWLQRHADVMIHIGAHGTLEWLPGKSVALSDACWPEALTGSLPVFYPFIVNDPGEAAQAKRRLGALAIGHIPPPLRDSTTPDHLIRLEALLDEFSTADGLDPKRRDRLQADIRIEASARGVESDLGINTATCEAEALTRIDRFVCDIKESQFGDGLHVWGRAPADASFEILASVEAEKRALGHALQGCAIAPGPAGSPYRGRSDVLPTGRNLFSTDPRSVPSRSAYAQGCKLADELVRRHLQDHGDWPAGLVVDLWGSATMRTAGEEFAMALALVGARPVWDDGSERVSGVEILPITELDRPRLDVTLRVSGLFRDVFPTLSSLFGQAIKALAERDEAPDWNPYVAAEPRVFGPAPGQYGLGMGTDMHDYGDAGREAAGKAWLAASAWALDMAEPAYAPNAIAERVAKAEAFVHIQDLPETDLLLAGDYAAHEAGFAAAQSVTGGSAALYHMDSTRPDRPRARGLTEEIARVVQARAANPDWISGMMRHGFRGAAEIAATLDHMAAFAQLAAAVPAHLFDLYFDATLGQSKVVEFLAQENPQALAAMHAQFTALDAAGLWASRRNSIRATLAAAE
jgi:cobaltochelatase CobN